MDSSKNAILAVLLAAAFAQTEAAVAAPSWADPKHPEIDYRTPIFMGGHDAGDTMFGWWMLGRETSRLDDSLRVMAKNVSQFDLKSRDEQKLLVAKCEEGQTGLVFVTGQTMFGDSSDPGPHVDYRIDNNPPGRKRWASITSRTGAGLFGGRAVNFMRNIKHAQKLYLRITDSNGRTYDSDFDMAGSERAFQAVAVACGWDLWEYATEDYQEIQKLLNAAGFDPGSMDGRWGEASERALAAFQASVGRAPSGLPDYESIKALGFR